MKAVKKLVAGLGLTVALGLGATAAQASEGGCGTYKTVDGKDAHLACEKAPVDLTNKASIQRGASLFMPRFTPQRASPSAASQLA